MKALFLAVLALPAAAHAANLIVQLPKDAALHVLERNPPAGVPRIDCPPTCVYTSPGKEMDVLDINVEPDPDPRTGDRPWDIIAMHGCRGTSALPADNGKCILNSEGDSTISFDVRYRPILAVTFAGTYGAPLAFFVSGNAGPGYQGSGASFACDPTEPNIDVSLCAAHLSEGQPVQVDSPSSDRATLVSRSGPCAGQPRLCVFELVEDVCIAHAYVNSSIGPTMPLTQVVCPTGPGTTPTGGGGGGGGGGGPPPELKEIKDKALEEIRRDLVEAVYPCVVSASGVIAFFAIPLPVGPLFGGALTLAATPYCASLRQRILGLSQVYDDPPDLGFGTIARVEPSARPSLDLPSCTGLSGADRRACRKLEKLLRRHLGKVQHAADVTTALRITVERASGALDAGDQHALKRQLGAAKKRDRQLGNALAASGRSGEQLATLLRGAGVTAAVSEAEFASATDVILGALAADGLPDAQARTLFGPALTPVAIDPLAVLGRP